MCVHQHTQDVRGCSSVHISARWPLDSACWPFPWTIRVILAHVGCLFSTHRTSVVVRQHTQDVRGCPCVSVCARQHTHDVRGCLSVSVCVRQHTQDVCGCPCVFVSTHMTSLAVCDSLSAHIGRPWLSVGVRQHTQDVRGCPCVSVCIRQHTQDVRGCSSVYISARWSLDLAHRMSVAVRVCLCLSVS